MSYLAEVSERIRLSSHSEWREALKVQHAYLVAAFQVFREWPTQDNMIALNGAWALTARIMKEMPPEGGTGPLAGTPQPARLAA